MGYIGNKPSDGIVTGDNVLDGSIDTADIKDGAVTAAKIADGAAVPSQTGQSGKYLTTDGTTASWGAISQTAAGISYDNSSSGITATNLQDAIDEIATKTDVPVLSGPSSAAEQTVITYTITNWSSYTVLDEVVVDVSGGTVSRTNGTITWTLPDVTAQTNLTLSVSVDEVGKVMSDTRTATVTVYALESDTTILYENATISSTYFPNTIDNTTTVDLFGDGSGVAAWPFNNSVTEAGGNYTTTVTGASYITGKYGNALYGNGTSTRVTTNVPMPRTWSFAFWFKDDNNDSNIYKTILSTNQWTSTGGSGPHDWGIRWDHGNSGRMGWIIRSVADPFYFDNSVLDWHSNWNHVVVQFNGRGVEAFRNGVALPNVFVAPSGYQWKNLEAIMQSPWDNANGYVKGGISNLRMFNRALTVDEIKVVMAEDDIDLSGSTIKATEASVSITSTVVEQDVGDGDFYNPDLTVKFVPNQLTIEPRVAGSDGTAVHDIFGDGSAIATYNFADDNGNDVGGNYNLTATNISYAAGKFNRAAYLTTTGSNAKLSVSGLDLGTDYLTTWSISFWINTAGLQSRNTPLFTFGNNTLITTNYQSTNGFSIHQPGVKEQSTDGGISNNEWNHVVLTFNTRACAYDNQKWYFNGARQSTSDQGGDFASFTGDFEINYGLNGYVSQVRLFNKILKQDEIYELMRETAPASNTAISLTGQAIGSSDSVYVNDANTTVYEVTSANIDKTYDTLNTHDIFGDSSCVATYQFNGTANDMSGNYSSSNYFADFGAKGKFGKCARFDATASHYIALPIDYIANASISGWFFFLGDQLIRFIGCDSASDSNINFFCRKNADNTFVIGAGGQVSNGSKVHVPGGWHHYVFVYGSNYVDIYIDSVFFERVSFTNSIQTDAGANNLYLFTHGGIYHSGKVDQFRVFNKNLSDTEIKKLYNEGKYNLNLSSLSLTNTPTLAMQKAPSISTSLVASGGADSFASQTPTSFTVTGNNVSGTTAGTHDLFGDGSALATYRLNGNANDLGGNYNGTPSGVIWADGKFAGAAEFTGGEYIAIPDFLTGRSAITISIWFYATVPQQPWDSDSNGAVWNFGDAGSRATGFNVNNANHLSGWLWTTDGIHSGPSIDAANDGRDGEWPPFEWHMATLTYDGSYIRTYIDGIQRGSDFATTGTIVAGNSYWIGCYDRLGEQRSWTGYLEQMRFFNRALNQSEIDKLYLEGEASSIVTANYDTQTGSGRDHKVKVDLAKPNDEVTSLSVAISKSV